MNNILKPFLCLTFVSALALSTVACNNDTVGVNEVTETSAYNVSKQSVYGLTFDIPASWERVDSSNEIAFVEKDNVSFSIVKTDVENINKSNAESYIEAGVQAVVNDGGVSDFEKVKSEKIANSVFANLYKAKYSEDNKEHGIGFLVIPCNGFILACTYFPLNNNKYDFDTLDTIISSIEVPESLVLSDAMEVTTESTTSMGTEATTTKETETSTTKQTETTTADPGEKERRDIESTIKDRVFSEYSPTSITDISINDNLGTSVDGDYIVLAYFKWDVMNSGELSKKVIEMYSSDLAATIAKEQKNVQELVMFWEVPYLNTQAKVSYERSGDNMSKADSYFDSNFD